MTFARPGRPSRPPCAPGRAAPLPLRISHVSPEQLCPGRPPPRQSPRPRPRPARAGPPPPPGGPPFFPGTICPGAAPPRGNPPPRPGKTARLSLGTLEARVTPATGLAPPTVLDPAAAIRVDQAAYTI